MQPPPPQLPYSIPNILIPGCMQAFSYAEFARESHVSVTACDHGLLLTIQTHKEQDGVPAGAGVTTVSTDTWCGLRNILQENGISTSKSKRRVLRQQWGFPMLHKGTAVVGFSATAQVRKRTLCFLVQPAPQSKVNAEFRLDCLGLCLVRLRKPPRRISKPQVRLPISDCCQSDNCFPYIQLKSPFFQFMTVVFYCAPQQKILSFQKPLSYWKAAIKHP